MYKVSIALRYLFSRWINYLAMAAVALAVAANLVVISVLSGFLQEAKRIVKGVNGDLVVRAKGDFYSYERLLENIRTVEGVDAASPFVDSICVVSGTSSDRRTSFQKPCHFKGVVLDEERKVNDFVSFLTSQDGKTPDFSEAEAVDSPTPGKLYPGILVGDKFFSRYNEVTHKDDNLLEVGGLLTVYTVPLNDTDDKVKAQRKTFRIAGFFNSGLWSVDNDLVLIPMDIAQLLRKMEGAIDGVTVKVKAGHDRDLVRKTLEDGLYMTDVLTWEEVDEIALGTATFQLKIMRVIMFFLLLITGFMIMALLTTSVYQKFREIGILKAMGATAGGITSIFFLNGMFICVFGTLVGMGAGMTVLIFINPICDTILAVTGYEVFPTKVYYLTTVPVDFNPWNYLAIFGIALLTSGLASVLPALRAGSMDPVRALYYE